MNETRVRPVQVELPDNLAKIQCVTDRKPWALLWKQSGETWEPKHTPPTAEPMLIDQVAVVERGRDLEKMKNHRFVVEIR